MLNYEAIAKSSAKSIIAEIQKEIETKDGGFVYHNAKIDIDCENNKITVTVMRKDQLGIEYSHTEEATLKL